MKKGFYPKLALTGIRKNKRMYTPYILTCAGMIMMYYIIAFLSDTQLMSGMRGGDTLRSILGLGKFVIAAFSAIFLFYTNSFLVRRRKKEFGLYNILGMGKRNIAKILFFETIIIFCISFVAGSLGGIVFSKLAELGLVKIMHAEVSYALNISWNSLLYALTLFAAIFAVIFLNTMLQVRLSNPTELLKSENTGEKPPKANWFFGLIGVVLLAGAYYLAVSIESPLSALVWFFIAVLMVIAGTYLLFVSGSVLFCRILQKRKKYYYKRNHFVSVSSMVYRMKRNGAGLASICILSTMVMVMLSSTTCLYVGTEDSLRTRYPQELSVRIDARTLSDLSDERTGELRNTVFEAVNKKSFEPQNVKDYRMAAVTAIISGNRLELGDKMGESFDTDAYNDIAEIYFIPLDDYNSMAGKNETLGKDEVMIFTTRMNYDNPTVLLSTGKEFNVKKHIDSFSPGGDASVLIIPSMYIIIPDIESCLSDTAASLNANDSRIMQMAWYCMLDIGADDDAQLEVYESLRAEIRQLSLDNSIYTYSCDAIAAERDDFYGTYGGAFFLGIMLSIVFLFAAVLIIYYKQISEGYEDESRFEIMQKVGMTKRDIRKSINSQLLTVFILPPVAAGIHLAFAFPMIYKMLMLFNLINLPLLLITTAASFLIFVLFYALVYRVTSNAYYKIVSGAK